MESGPRHGEVARCLDPPPLTPIPQHPPGPTPVGAADQGLLRFDFPCEIIYNNFIIQRVIQPDESERKTVKAPLIFSILLPAAALGIFIGTLQAAEALQAPTTPQPPITEKQLKSAVNNSLWRLKHAIDKEGFYAARIALNIWRSTALDAGVFDPAEYDAYKEQIYAKSILNSLQCVEAAIQHGFYRDAKSCLHTWKTHSEEMGTFDAHLYEELAKKIK
jgi:hypothetical protein